MGDRIRGRERQWSEREIEQLVERRRRGETWRAIVAALDIPRSSCMRMFAAAASGQPAKKRRSPERPETNRWEMPGALAAWPRDLFADDRRALRDHGSAFASRAALDGYGSPVGSSMTW